MLAFATSLALVAGLCPVAAFADENAEGNLDEPELAALSVADDAEESFDLGEITDEGASAGPELVVAASGETDIASAYSMKSFVPYTGSALHPDLQIVLNGKALVEGVDYEVTAYYDETGAVVSQVVDPGTYRVSLKGIGSYSGTNDDVSFLVGDYGNFTDAEANEPRVVYTGSEVHPTFDTTLNGVKLEFGVDYVIEGIYKRSEDGITPVTPVEIGEYYVILKGVDARGYSGTTFTYFFIVDGDAFESGTVTGLNNPYRYTGSAVNPEFTFTLPSGKVLVEGVDFERRYQTTWDSELLQWNTATSIVEEGNYGLVLIGKGAYEGAKAQLGNVQIAKPEHDITTATISGVDIRYYYTGAAPIEGLTVKIGSKTLTEGTDYDVWVFRSKLAQVNWKLPEMIYPHHYYVRVRGTGGYYGQVFKELYIVDAPGSVDPDAGETVVDSSTGVALGGTLFEEMEVDGNEVAISVDDVAVANASRNTELTSAYKGAKSEFFKAFNISLDLFDADGNLVAPLTEKLGNLRLTFPVDKALNGRTATIVQLHKGASGAIEEIRTTATVVDGGVTVVTDKLSEFVITVDGESEGVAGEQAGDDKPKVREASALPPTGEGLPASLPGMLLATALVAGASLVVLKREAGK